MIYNYTPSFSSFYHQTLISESLEGGAGAFSDTKKDWANEPEIFLIEQLLQCSFKCEHRIKLISELEVLSIT